MLGGLPHVEDFRFDMPRWGQRNSRRGADDEMVKKRFIDKPRVPGDASYLDSVCDLLRLKRSTEDQRCKQNTRYSSARLQDQEPPKN